MIKPYEGNEPYIFVSYAHKNNELVIPIIERLIADGYRVWYDEGIKPSIDYDLYITNHINKCTCFLPLFSPEYFESDYCNKEFSYAIRRDKKPYPIYLSETKIPDTYDIHIGGIQTVFKYIYDNLEEFYSKVYSAEIIAPCKFGSEIKKVSEPVIPPVDVHTDKSEFTIVGTQLVKYNGSKTSVAIPKGITYIRQSAFRGNDKINQIIIPTSVTRIEEFAFEDCTNLVGFYYQGNKDKWDKIETVCTENSEGSKYSSRKKAYSSFLSKIYIEYAKKPDGPVKKFFTTPSNFAYIALAILAVIAVVFLYNKWGITKTILSVVIAAVVLGIGFILYIMFARKKYDDHMYDDVFDGD